MRRLVTAVAITIACVVVAGPAAAQQPSRSATTAPVSKTPAVKELRLVEVLPMTCTEAWAASGRSYTEMFRIMAAMATLSLNNRELTFPDTREAGDDAGKSIAADCKADPNALLFAIVDTHVRRIAEAARK